MEDVTPEKVEQFLASVPDSDEIVASHRRLVPHLGYFLTECLGDVIVSPARIGQCYDSVRLKRPKNISDVMNKSRAFVRTKRGFELGRDVRTSIASSISKAQPYSKPVSKDEGADLGRSRNVAVVYGRNEKLRKSMFGLLRSIKLNPIEWNEAVIKTGKATPMVAEVLGALFDMAQAVVVMFTPDEKAQLRSELRKKKEDGKTAWQPRPNVLIEAGMALAKNEGRTIIVHVGSIRAMSDLEGRHVLHLTNSAQSRHEFVHRLRLAGGAPNTDGSDWLNEGDFDCCP